MTNVDAEVVRDIVAGDAALLATLEAWPRERIDAAIAGGPLTLTADAVCRVLAAFQAGGLDATTAQRWGAAMRWGGYRELGTTSLDVNPDLQSEEPILDAIERLDELGDLVDGEFRPGEIDQIVSALRNGT